MITEKLDGQRSYTVLKTND